MISPADLEELDRTCCELDDLLQAPRLRSPIANRQSPIHFAPGRDVSSAPFPTATSLAPDPVRALSADGQGPTVCPFCALERAMSRCSKTERTGLVRVQSCERHCCAEQPPAGLPSEVSCPAEPPTITPAGAVDALRPLYPAA